MYNVQDYSAMLLWFSITFILYDNAVRTGIYVNKHFA